MRLRSVADDEADRFFPDGGADRDEQVATGDVLLEMGAIQRSDVGVIEQRRRETGESFAEAALSLGLADEALLTRAAERQQNFVVLTPADERISKLVVASFDPTDPLSQTARNLRSTLSAMTDADGEPLRVVVIVAAGTRAEAGLVVANLAVACAQAGYRTLLVDANYAAPVQHELFRTSNRTGLSAMLAGGQASDATQPTAIHGLSVIPSGPIVRNFAELFDRAGLHGRLRELADDYDLVLVDASHDDQTIAAAAAEGTDGAIVVVRRRSSLMGEVKSLIERLESRRVPVLGTVLTD